MSEEICLIPDTERLEFSGNNVVVVKVPVARLLGCILCEWRCIGLRHGGHLGTKAVKDHYKKEHKRLISDFALRCRFCDFVPRANQFARKFLNDHVIQQHANAVAEPREELQFKCSICEEEFPAERGLISHLQSHKNKPEAAKASIREVVPSMKSTVKQNDVIDIDKSMDDVEVLLPQDNSEGEPVNKESINLSALVGKDKPNQIHLDRLRKNAWIDDVIITSFLNYLVEGNTNLMYVDPLLWNNSFLPATWESFRTLNRVPTVPYHSTTWELTIFPINIDNHHWTLAVLDRQKSQVIYYDTLRGRLSSGLRDKLILSCELILGSSCSFHYAFTKSFVRQNDGINCGPLVCMLADRVSKKQSLNFHLESIKKWREAAHEYLSNGNAELLKDWYVPCEQKSFNEPLVKDAKVPQNGSGIKSTKKAKIVKKSNFQIDQWLLETLDMWEAKGKDWGLFEQTISVFTKIVKLWSNSKFEEAEIFASNHQSEVRYFNPLRKSVGTQTERLDNNRKPYSKAKPKQKDDKLWKLYNANKKSAVERILNPNTNQCSIPLNVIEKHFRNSCKKVSLDERALDSELNNIVMPEIPEDSFASEIQPSDVLNVLKKSKRSSPGADKVSYKELAQADPSGKALAKIFTICWQMEKIPQEWKKSDTILIYKKGNQSDITNWRPISLQLTVYKIYSSIMARRLQNASTVLSWEQKGFVDRPGCTENISIVKECISVAKRDHRFLAMAFLDFGNAFGSVPHELIIKTVKKMGFPDKIVNILKDLYSRSYMTVKTANGKTNEIPVEAGVKQGDPLSPLLFNMALEHFPAVEKRKDFEIHYYQWVPIFLFFQLLCSFVPKKICNKFTSFSSLNFHEIIKNFGDGENRHKKFMATPEANEKEIREAAKYFLSAMKFQKIRIDSFIGIFSTKFHCNYLTMVYLCYKLSNFINSFAQLYFMNQFFNTSYKFWGFGVLKDLISMRDWKASGNFPRVTFCDFERRDDTSGRQMIYPVQCVLMINMVIEKLYIILWFWFLILTIMNFANFVSWLLFSFNPEFSKEFVNGQLTYSNCKNFDEDDVPKFIKDQIIKDGITVLRLISEFSGNRISSDCIAIFYEEWKKEQKQQKENITSDDIKKINDSLLEPEMMSKKTLLLEIITDSQKG